MARTVLVGESGTTATASQRVPLTISVSRHFTPAPVRPMSALAAFAQAKRHQLEVLTSAEVVTALHLESEGRTRLASLLPAPEPLPEAVARRGLRRGFNLHRSRPMALRLERS